MHERFLLESRNSRARRGGEAGCETAALETGSARERGETRALVVTVPGVGATGRLGEDSRNGEVSPTSVYSSPSAGGRARGDVSPLSASGPGIAL